MKKKLLIILMLCSAFYLYAEGDMEYSSTPNKSQPRKTQQVRSNSNIITIGCYGDLEKSMKAVTALPEFKNMFPDVRIDFQSSDFGGHHNRLVTQIAAGTGANDIEIFETGYLARFAKNGGFTDLSKAPYNADQAGRDLVKFAMANATTEKGNILAMPIDVSPAVLYYRKSIAEKAGVKMDNLSSWDAYIEAGKKMTRDMDGDGTIDQYALTHVFDMDKTVLNGSGAGWYKNGRPYEPVIRFLNALELAGKIKKSGITANYRPWSGDWINSFKEEEVVTMISGSWLGGHFKNWMAPDLSGDWRITYLPGKTYASYGGTYIGIPEQTDPSKKQKCFEIVKYLTTNPEAQLKSFEVSESFPSLTTVYNNPVMDKPIKYFGMQKTRKIFVDILMKIPPHKLNSNDAAAVDIYNKAVSNIVDNGITVDEAYNEMVKKINNEL